MIRARALCCALFALSTILVAQAETLTTALSRRDSAAAAAWFEANPERVHSSAKARIERVLAGGADAAASEEELRFLAAVLEGRPTGRLIERVLGWGADEREVFRMLRGDLVSGALELDAALAEFEALGADALVLREVGAKAHAAYAENDFAAGLDIMRWVLREAERAEDPWTHAWSENWCGQVEWIRGELEAAAAHLERAAELEEVLGDDALRVRQYADLTRVSGSRGEVDVALGWADKAEQLARSMGSDESLCEALLVRAGMLVDLGEHERALELSLQLAPAEGDGPASGGTRVRVDMVTASALSDIGRFESALVFAKRALADAQTEAVARTMPMLVLEARLILGLLLGDLGRFDEGLRELDLAREFAAGRGDERALAWADKNEGWIAMAMGDRARASEALDAARAFGAKTGEEFLEGICALGVAEALVLGARSADDFDAERVDVLLARAEEIGRDLRDLEFRWRVAAVRGRAFSLRGDEASALAAFGRSVDDIERWRRRLASPALVAHALRARTDPYRGAAICAARLGRVDDALRYTELLHARVLFELRSGAGLGSAADPEARRGVDELRARIARLAFRAREGVASADERDELDAAEDQLDATLLAVEMAGNRRSATSAPASASLPWRDALARSDVDVVLDFLVGLHSTLVFTLDEGGARVVEVPLGAEDLDRRVRRLREPIERLQRGEIDLAHLDFDVRGARELYDLLLAPALPDALVPGALLGVLPDASLNSLPFEVLVSGGELAPYDPSRPFAHLADLRFVGDAYAISVLSSIAALSSGAGAGLERVCVVLPPAEVGVAYAALELATLRTAFGAERVVVIENATPADLERDAPRVAPNGVLHFTAHGVLDGASPARGHLVLGGAEPGTGAAQLAAWQVEALELDADLVVLSACHTGEGAWLPGEGLLGLTRAFFTAGASEVVASLWAVDDASTVAFMGAFYRALGKGASPASALRTARATTRAEVGTHPYLWGAWIARR